MMLENDLVWFNSDPGFLCSFFQTGKVQKALLIPPYLAMAVPAF